jgi:hypothetical protein
LLGDICEERMHFELKLGRYDSRINTNPLPSRSFVTAAIELPLVAAAPRPHNGSQQR